jgi:GAF domain-containing protein
MGRKSIMTNERLRVLILDDEASLRKPLRRYLENDFGYDVDCAASGREALTMVDASQGHYDVALIDQHLESEPGQDGIEVMRKIRNKYPDIECIIFTGWGREHRQRALEAGVFRYLEKPFDNQELAMLIRTAAQQVRLRTISRDILAELDLNQVLEGIAAAARSLALADEAEIELMDYSSNCTYLGATTHPSTQLRPYALDGADLSQWIMQSKRKFYVADIQNDPKATPALTEAGLRSFVGVPVPGETHPLGVLYVYSQKPGHFDAWGTIALLETLASQAGLAITNARAFNQIQDHAGYMEALVRIGRGLTQVRDLEAQLHLAWEFVHQQFQVSTFYIALYDEHDDVLRFPLIYDHGQTVTANERYLTDDQKTWGISGYVVKTTQEVQWSTAEDGETLCHVLDIEPIPIGNTTQCQSCFTCPLKISNRTIGVISIQSDSRFAFSDIILDAFRALGSQLSVALESTRLFNEEARRRQEAEALREATLTLATSLRGEGVFDRILVELRKVVPFDSASIQLLRDNHLEITEGWGFPHPEALLGVRFSLDDDNPNREVVQRRAPLIVPDAPKRYQHMASPPHDQLGIRSWLGVPMFVGQTLIGMLALDKQEANFYTKEHARLTQAFAAQAAVTIHNARLFREVNDAQAQLQAFYQASTAIVSSKDPEAVLKDIVDRACTAAQAYGVSLILIDQAGRIRQVITAGADWADSLRKLIRKNGNTMKVLHTGTPVIIENVAQDPSRVNPTTMQRGIAAEVCLPVMLEGERIGVVWVRYAKPRGFSQSEIDAIQLYVNQAALAYDSARRIKELDNFRKVAETLAGAADLREVLLQIVIGAREILRADAAAIWSYDDVRGEFLLDRSVSSGIPSRIWEKFLAEKPRLGRTAYTVMEQGWIGVTDVSDTEHYVFLGESTRQLLKQINIRSFQGIALSVGDEKLGVLYVNYTHYRDFSLEEQQRARAVANHAALALKKARLLEQVARARDTAKVVAEVSVLEDLHRTLDAIVEGTLENLACDAVSLYIYNQAREEFEFPPALIGVRNVEAILAPGYEARHSVVWKILLLEEMHVAENAAFDPVMRGTFVEMENIVSSVGIPLHIGKDKVGVMFANYRTPHHFTSEELANIKLFSHQAAVAIRNAQLYDEATRRADILAILDDAGKIVTSTLALEEILDRIVEQAWNFTGHYGKKARFADLSLIENNALKRKATYPRKFLSTLQEIVGDIDLQESAQVGIIGKVALSGQALLLDDVSEDPNYIQYDPETRSELTVPMKIGDEVIGVINVEHPEHNAFHPDDLLGLEALAAQAAIAIRNAQLYKDLARRAQVLETLYEAGKAVTSTLSLDDILNQIAEQAWNLTHREGRSASFSNLAKVQDNRLISIGAHPPDCLPELQCKLGEVDLSQNTRIGIMGQAVKTGQSKLVGDVKQNTDYIEYDPLTRSELAVPISLGGHIIGVINVEHPDVDAFDREDQRALELLAAQAAIAIRNAKMYEELKHAKGQIVARTMLAWAGMTSAAWRHTIEKHALTIREQTQLLQGDFERMNLINEHPKLLGRLTRIERLATEILKKPITPPLSSETGITSIPLNSLVGERARQLWRNPPYRHVKLTLKLELPGWARVLGSAEWIRTAFDSLVENAVKAVEHQPVQEVTICTQRAGTTAEILIADTGPGIPDDVRNKIGLDLIEKSEDAKGLGMGLLMSQVIVQTYGGEIRVACTGSQGTTMVIALPLDKEEKNN